ncbi:biotin and thiamin synthesis associated [Akkermansia muciniphila CAG:154]|nr:biotin and thiamin synthesis associated [Akkermansia muciniphila CAG:154]
MSFSEELNGLMDCPTPLVRRFMALLEPVDDARLEAMAQESRRLTRLHFGRTIRLFAPIYLSNECINNCKYCGFSRDNPIIRTTLTVDEVVQEARYLHGLGLRSILLVAGEHPKFVSRILPGTSARKGIPNAHQHQFPGHSHIQEDGLPAAAASSSGSSRANSVPAQKRSHCPGMFLCRRLRFSGNGGKFPNIGS